MGKADSFRSVLGTGEIRFVCHWLGGGNPSPLMAHSLWESFAGFISLWNSARTCFVGGFQPVAIMSRIARACLGTVD